MQYRINPKNGDRISALGFGCMRFHRDEKEAENQLGYAIGEGVNYLDTAYLYPDNEATLGRILSRTGLRDKVKIATKMPQYLVRKREDLDRFFAAELSRLQTGHIDYYLMHMMSDFAGWNRLAGLGLVRWIEEKKRAGQIINIGFSFHGPTEEFIRILDAYDWDFTMIQYNYLDENNQAGRTGLEYAAQKGIPVMVMEPLRGGTLVNNLPPGARKLWEQARPLRSPADWGLRWVLNHPQVLCVLSGMGTRQMVEENIATAQDALPNSLTGEQLELYGRVKKEILAATKVPCTGCGYCLPCPKGVNIPLCFACLNDTVTKGRLKTMYWYILMAKGHNASLCVECGKCEGHCPQAIPIREKLRQTRRDLEGFPYGMMKAVVERVLNR